MLGLGLLAFGLLAWSVPVVAQSVAPSGAQQERVHANEVVIEDVTNSDGIRGLRATFQVKATRHAVWSLLTDYGHYREIFTNVQELEVLEENEHGARVHFRVKASWLSFQYTLQRDYEELDRKLTWHRVGGDFKNLVGEWLLRDGADRDHSIVSCESFIDIGYLIPSELVRAEGASELRRSMLRIRERLETGGLADMPSPQK